jgi:hypothetical protein
MPFDTHLIQARESDPRQVRHRTVERHPLEAIP